MGASLSATARFWIFIVMAALLLVAVGVFALRNPALVAAVVKAFFDAPGGPPPPPRSR